MWGVLIGLLSVVLGTPLLTVNWSDSRAVALTVRAKGHDDILDQCARGGIEVRYRYTLKICHRRRWWLDRCSSDVELVRSLQFDPISESYRIMRDRLGDGEAPEFSRMPEVEDAFNAISTLDDLPLALLADDDVPTDRADYLSMRVLSDCKSEYSQLESRVSAILTLGIIKIGSFDSGWSDFDLGGKRSADPFPVIDATSRVHSTRRKE